MRVIKFRARFRKISNSKECWQKIVLTINHITTLNNMFGYTQISEWEQHTGLKDVNGVGVYIGDVIETTSCKIKLKRKIYQAENGAFCINIPVQDLTDAEGMPMQLYSFNERFKIIGNIHENPELIN